MKFTFKRSKDFPTFQLTKTEYQWLFFLFSYSTGPEKYVVCMSPRLVEKFIKTAETQGVKYSESHARNSFYKLVKAGIFEPAPTKGTYLFNQSIFSYE